MRKLFWLPLLLSASFASAQEITPERLVDKAIEHAGGWQAWLRTRNIQFRKTIVRFDADEKATETKVQFHKYVLQPSPQMRLEWESNGSKGIFINDGQQAWKFVNGKPATTQDDVNGARNNTFGSHYVFSMPFKLRDSGTQLENAGTMTMADGTVLQKIRTTYAKGAGDAGGMHTWTYMFDPQTGRLVCNHLQYAADKYDWTEYFDEKPVGSLLLSTRRVGYEADANGKVGTKRSETTYDQIQTDVDFPPHWFQPPR